jgi:hypothetical protein
MRTLDDFQVTADRAAGRARGAAARALKAQQARDEEEVFRAAAAEPLPPLHRRTAGAGAGPATSE